MRVDETGYNDHAGGVDYRCVARLQAWPDRLDALRRDQHVTACEVANHRVHRQHVAPADEQPAPILNIPGWHDACPRFAAMRCARRFAGGTMINASEPFRTEPAHTRSSQKKRAVQMDF